MTIHTKSAFLLLGTLLMGGVLGALLMGAIQQKRLEQIGDMRSPFGLTRILEEAIAPESEEQRQAIRAVLDEAGPQGAEILFRFRNEMQAHIESVKASLEPYLSEAQLRRLERRMQFRPEGRFLRDLPPEERERLRQLRGMRPGFEPPMGPRGPGRFRDSMGPGVPRLRPEPAQ